MIRKKIVLLGDQAIGKISLVRRFVEAARMVPDQVEVRRQEGRSVLQRITG